MISVILNCYNRPEYLEEQINAIRNQTIKPDDISIWYNKPEDGDQYDFSHLNCNIVCCNTNYKFHGRFAYALLAKTEYVAIFDDDTIPGSKWFESCINTMKTNEGIMGTAGVILDNGNSYNPHQKVGWNGIQSESPIEVDLVGHAWFFKREWLKYMWYDYPVSWHNGEDIQFSSQCKRYGNIKTFVPPHGNDKEMWGSIKGNNYGNDDKASYKKPTHNNLRDNIVKICVNKGWEIVRAAN